MVKKYTDLQNSIKGMANMNKKFGLYCMGTIVNTYDDAIEAHNDAVYAQEESGVPHEVREIKQLVRRYKGMEMT